MLAEGGVVDSMELSPGLVRIPVFHHERIELERLLTRGAGGAETRIAEGRFRQVEARRLAGLQKRHMLGDDLRYLVRHDHFASAGRTPGGKA